MRGVSETYVWWYGDSDSYNDTDTRMCAFHFKTRLSLHSRPLPIRGSTCVSLSTIVITSLIEG